MSTAEILETIRDDYPDCLLADGFDEAIVGIVERACQPAVVCYDYGKCVKALVKRDGMSEEEATEFLDFNTVQAYVGERTPVFLHRFR